MSATAVVAPEEPRIVVTLPALRPHLEAVEELDGMLIEEFHLPHHPFPQRGSALILTRMERPGYGFIHTHDR